MSTNTPRILALPPDEHFFDALAGQLLSSVASAALPTVQIVVPALPMAAEWRAALVRAAPQTLLLPRFDTLRNWVLGAELNAPPEALAPPMPDCQRQALLYDALRARGWFDDSALWGIAAEMTRLFDELTAASVRLPRNVDELLQQLQRTYALRASAPLAFETRVVHELWHALSESGAPDAVTVYRLRLAALARRAGSTTLEQPLWLLLDAPPEEALDAAEREFVARYAAAQPVCLCHPVPREDAYSPLSATLAAGWPPAGETVEPLFGRARTLAACHPEGPLSGRLQLVPVNGREQEAQAALAQVASWLVGGLRRIVIVAQDRLTARRVRALLERENVLVSDETGWLLTTSRAAATLDALLEVVSGQGYHRDLLDLCKSPFVFADVVEAERLAAVSALEATLREAAVKTGLARAQRALQARRDGGADSAAASRLLDRIAAASVLLGGAPAPIARWLERLRKALQVLGADTALAADTAGRALLELLDERREQLTGHATPLTLSVWRDWLRRELEAASFRDTGIASPIVMTPLNATSLRRFEAALLLGGDAGQLAPAGQSEFFNTSVRRELGLRTHEDGERELKRDLELLLTTVPRVVVTWQAQRDGEAKLLAPELSLLSTLHRLAWGDDLQRRPLPPRGELGVDPASAPDLTRRAAPRAPSALLPGRVSVSGYASLVACPYRFFARHVLGLGVMDEISEEMDKSAYGELVHRVLERFHASCPEVSVLSEEDALRRLRACSDEVFAAAVADNFLSTGWRLRWEKHLSAYLAWQREREAEGWRWQQAEARVACTLPLAHAGEVELYGRIDRIDGRAKGTEDAENGAAALYDYKTQAAGAVRERLADDVQLPAYALMHGHAAQAAYVALDDERGVKAVAAADDAESLHALAALQGERLVAAFDALHAGAPLTAHGVEEVCRWCEMRGLCRKDFA